VELDEPIPEGILFHDGEDVGGTTPVKRKRPSESVISAEAMSPFRRTVTPSRPWVPSS